MVFDVGATVDVGTAAVGAAEGEPHIWEPPTYEPVAQSWIQAKFAVFGYPLLHAPAVHESTAAYLAKEGRAGELKPDT